MIEDFTKHMKALCTIMRRGKTVVNIDILDLSGSYYDEILPHYEEFADTLIEYRHAMDFIEDEIFDFSVSFVPREVLDALQNALHHTHFQNLSFRQQESRECSVL